MATPFLYLSSSLEMLQSQESSVKPTTLADATYNTTETRYFTKDTTDNHHHQQQHQQHQHQYQQHQQPIPEIPSMSLLPELILSSWLQSEVRKKDHSSFEFERNGKKKVGMTCDTKMNFISSPLILFYLSLFC